MVLGGLWHGASLTFIAWGALHGGALAIERYLRWNRMNRSSPVIARFAWFVTVQTVVLVTWILFRSQSIEEAGRMITGILSANFSALQFDAVLPILCAAPIVAAHIRGFLAERAAQLPVNLSPNSKPGVGWNWNFRPLEQAVVAGLMLVTILTCYAQSTDFMYFQF
jgi:alginate O-acetyltransferase complex protein AlgI